MRHKIFQQFIYLSRSFLSNRDVGSGERLTFWTNHSLIIKIYILCFHYSQGFHHRIIFMVYSKMVYKVYKCISQTGKCLINVNDIFSRFIYNHLYFIRKVNVTFYQRNTFIFGKRCKEITVITSQKHVYQTF